MTLFLPPDINYHCTQCGRSCTMFEEIHVEPRSEELLRSLDYKPLMVEGTDDLDPVSPGLIDPENNIMTRHCGTCVFQHKDGLCAVHGKYGLMKKPQTCRDFPFRFVQTPGGVYTGLSFACSAVLENEGPPVEGQREYLEENEKTSNAKRKSDDYISLTDRHEVSWEAYLDLEGDLKQILSRDDKAISYRLAAQSIYIDIFGRFIREVRGDIPKKGPSPFSQFERGRFPENTGPVSDRDILEKLRKTYLEQDHGNELFRLATKIPHNPTLQRVFVGLVTGFRQSFHNNHQRPSRLRVVTKVTRHYLAAAAKLGKINLEPLENPVAYEAFRTIPSNFENDFAIDEVLARYFRHSMFRKDLLLSDSVLFGQRMMLLHFALIKWYSVGRASIMNREKVNLEDIYEAIRNIELHYLYHTRFTDLLDRLPTLAILTHSIATRPSFAGAMIGRTV